MTNHNSNLPLPEHAYAACDEQALVFETEAKILLSLAADKLTASGHPGQEHHELVVNTPAGDVARFTIDYAHDDCDIEIDDLDRIVSGLVDKNGYDHAIEVLENILEAVEDERYEARQKINEAVAYNEDDMANVGDDYDMDLYNAHMRGDYDPIPMPEVAGEGGSYYPTPVGSAVAQGTMSPHSAVAAINRALVEWGDEPLTDEEIAWLQSATVAIRLP